MKNTLKFTAILSILILSSCSSQLLVSTGAKDNKPLVFNNEYKTENLNEIEVEGAAFWGIPSASNNNSNKNNGIIFTFNGINIGKTPRLLPILTLLAQSAILTYSINVIAGQYESKPRYGYYQPAEYKDNLGLPLSFLISIPVAGTLNNFIWSNSALSGASASLNYRLINENPNVDIFFYPKYEIKKENYLWYQKATINARVSGATLNLTKLSETKVEKNAEVSDVIFMKDGRILKGYIINKVPDLELTLQTKLGTKMVLKLIDIEKIMKSND